MQEYSHPLHYSTVSLPFFVKVLENLEITLLKNTLPSWAVLNISTHRFIYFTHFIFHFQTRFHSFPFESLVSIKKIIKNQILLKLRPKSWGKNHESKLSANGILPSTFYSLLRTFWQTSWTVFLSWNLEDSLLSSLFQSKRIHDTHSSHEASATTRRIRQIKSMQIICRKKGVRGNLFEEVMQTTNAFALPEPLTMSGSHSPSLLFPLFLFTFLNSVSLLSLSSSVHSLEISLPSSMLKEHQNSSSFSYLKTSRIFRRNFQFWKLPF